MRDRWIFLLSTGKLIFGPSGISNIIPLVLILGIVRRRCLNIYQEVVKLEVVGSPEH